MARAKQYPKEFYYYMNIAENNGVGEWKYRHRVRRGYSYSVAAKQWDGVELTEEQNIQEIECLYKNDMPLKKSYIKYLESNQKLLNKLIKKYGYTKQFERLIDHEKYC